MPVASWVQLVAWSIAAIVYLARAPSAALSRRLFTTPIIFAPLMAATVGSVGLAQIETDPFFSGNVAGISIVLTVTLLIEIVLWNGALAFQWTGLHRMAERRPLAVADWCRSAWRAFPLVLLFNAILTVVMFATIAAAIAMIPGLVLVALLAVVCVALNVPVATLIPRRLRPGVRPALRAAVIPVCLHLGVLGSFTWIHFTQTTTEIDGFSHSVETRTVRMLNVEWGWAAQYGDEHWYGEVRTVMERPASTPVSHAANFAARVVSVFFMAAYFGLIARPPE